MRYLRRRHSGFSLIEIVLVAGLLMVLATVKFREMVDEADRLLGELAGQHIQLIGDAANTYIGNNAATLSAAATTVVTVADLKTAGVLDTGVSETNPWGSPYSLTIRRQGAGPYTFSGLVVATTPPVVGGNTRLDITGAAVQAAGVNGGMAYAANQVSGARNAWTAMAADYPAITAIGQLAYRLQGASMDGIYLRRDGLYPMTGNLNMGNQNIAAANEVTMNDGLISSVNPAVRSSNRLTTMAPVLVEMESFAVNHGANIPSPVCSAGGSPQVFIIPQVFSTISMGGPGGYNFIATPPGPGPWVADMRDSSNVPLPADQFSLARTFCSYRP